MALVDTNARDKSLTDVRPIGSLMTSGVPGGGATVTLDCMHPQRTSLIITLAYSDARKIHVIQKICPKKSAGEEKSSFEALTHPTHAKL